MKKWSRWAMQMNLDVAFSTFRRHKREKRHLKHCIKEKVCSGFLFRKALWKARYSSEYCVMPQIRRRNTYRRNLQEAASLHIESVNYSSVISPITMGDTNQWYANMQSTGYWGQRHVGSQSPHMTKVERTNLQNLRMTLWT